MGILFLILLGRDMCRAESGTLRLFDGYAAPKVAPSKQAYIECMKYGIE